MLGVAAIVALLVPRSTRHDATHTYVTTAAQSAMVTLPDGSRATLAPSSQLTVNMRSRTVQLTGEAFFDVTPDRHTPFVVQSGHINTRVLGTSFDVRHYADDSRVQVAVVSGKVVVSPSRRFGTGAQTGLWADGTITLAAGMVGQFTDSTIVTTTTVNPDTYADWTRGQLVFQHTPVPVVLETLGRWYGYEFRLSDSTLTQQHVTTVFNLGKTAEMMRALQRLLNVTITIQDSVALLRPTVSSERHAAPMPRLASPLHSNEVGR